MLIGVSGKISSGKDTIGTIIVGLCQGYKEEEILNWIKGNFTLDTRTGKTWYIEKFADKLKDMVCLLLGCTRADLEDINFKNRELGEEWKRWYYSNYKIKTNNNPTGRVSDLFSTKEEADIYKTKLPDTFSLSLCHTLESQLLTPRLILQQLGTEAGRGIIHPNIWINALFANYVKTFSTKDFIKKDGTSMELDTPKWIITDVRFPNEAKAIKDRNGILIRVERFNEKQSTHLSEIALDKYTDFNYVIDNNGSISDLMQSVKQILEKEKLL